MADESLDNALYPILDNEVYSSISFSVPSDEDRLKDNTIVLANWRPTEADVKAISHFNSLAHEDIPKLAELAKQRKDRDTPLLQAAFEDVITPTSHLSYKKFKESVPQQAVQAIEIFLHGILKIEESEQTYYHVRNVAAICTKMAGEIFDGLSSLQEITADSIKNKLHISVNDEDAAMLAEAFKMGREQFMALYCASALLHDFGKLFTPSSLLDYDKILPQKTFENIIKRIGCHTNSQQIPLYTKDGEAITGPEKYTILLCDIITHAQNFRQKPTPEKIEEIVRTFNEGETFTGLLRRLSSYYLDPKAKKPLLFPDEAAALSADPAHSKGTPSERDLINLHATHSGALLDELGVDNPVTKWMLSSAKYHHERMDGKGYGPLPERPKDIEIPLLGRTMKIIDSFESMVNGMRKYKHPRTLEQALHILHNKNPDGVQPTHPNNEFDTSLVDFVNPRFFKGFYDIISRQAQALRQNTGGLAEELSIRRPVRIAA